MNWEAHENAVLRDLWARGDSCSVIGAKMGKTRNAIIGRASRMGLPGRMTTERKARCYRSGPVSHEEKRRREQERLARRELAQAIRMRQKLEERQRFLDGSLPPLHIPETIQPPEFLALTFGELQRNQCRYPRGEGQDIRFCGQPKMKGQSYCQHCYLITHYKPSGPTPKRVAHWVDYRARAA